jgi:GTP:adenosylcobinamide-phosphate guanylyltransferase
MDALVTAGGIPKPDDPLYEYTQGGLKALIDIAGKPMVQWVLDAISGATKVDQVVVVGLEADSGVTCSKTLTFVPNQGGLIDNIRAGIGKIQELNPEAECTVMISGDIPAITAEMIDWVIETAEETDHALYYNVVTRETMEGRFPGSNRSYVKLKNLEICGSDLNVCANWTVTAKEGLWNRLAEARKNAFKQAALVGFDTLFYLLIRRFDLEGAATQVTKRLNITGRAIISPYAELAMDIDKPHQLEILRADLAQREAV